ncbi:TetR family transcriptional regulator [Brachybacterium sp. J144]|uniref:TetR/AcrR family transcriptional regulator n=1 Tax=Brachybacterium sp. J144 TaxID=3116487 RepID=UPI002E767192|nr:TetR family transcriptional regulator [Brachybacterium sp. J144]MEE1651060.1 TetR family transcriptional regulator [Brachybacterium sp. J144]
MSDRGRTDEHILRAALARFAVGGLRAPLRRVAEDAGVSAGLIIHHFGTRDALLAACDAHALEIARREKTKVVTGDSAALLTQLAQAEEYAPVVGYVLRRLQAGGPLAQQLVGDFVDDAAAYLAAGEEAGTISPSRDPKARAQVLTEMALGALVLQLPGDADPLDLEDLPRWMRDYSTKILLPVLELYTQPLLTDATLLEAVLAEQPPEGGTP